MIPKFRAINRLSEGYKYSDDFDSLSAFFKWAEDLVTIDQVEQFTGLFDKNGKEIYEGDILRVYPLGWSSNVTDPLQGNKEYTAIVEYINDRREIRCSPFFHSYQTVEIIGNKSLNPELFNI